VDRAVEKRMSNEFDSQTDSSNKALMHRVKGLEEQNARLSNEN
jgi:hypothetical protein